MNTRTLTIIGVILIAGIVVVAALSSNNGATLQGTNWEWNSMTETSPAAQSVVPNPSSYTITFNDDGTFNGQADCNLFSGTYTADNGQISLLMGPTTLAECGPDSIYNLYLMTLAVVDGYTLENGGLTLTFGDGAGEMMFKAP